MLKVREATAGTGCIAGSSLLNRIFQKHLEDRFKGSRGWDEEVLEEAMGKTFLGIRFFCCQAAIRDTLENTVHSAQANAKPSLTVRRKVRKDHQAKLQWQS